MGVGGGLAIVVRVCERLPAVEPRRHQTRTDEVVTSVYQFSLHPTRIIEYKLMELQQSLR